MIATATDIHPTPTGLRVELLEHPVYDRISTLDDVRFFMREHAFAVWDFMSLVKRLQHEVADCRVPWFEPGDAVSARLINEIVLGEESDEDGRGGFCSHFDLYLEAMADVGADRSAIDGFVSRLLAGDAIEQALNAAEVLPSTAEFVIHNIELALHGQPHEVAAVFCFGREDIIPDMFRRILTKLDTQVNSLDRFRYYLDRHIQVDGDQHGPMARQLVRHLCGGDAQKSKEAVAAASRAVQKRIELWNGIDAALKRQERR